MIKGRHWATYGAVILERQRCPQCRSMCLVVDGRLQCGCEKKAEKENNKYIEQMSPCHGIRRRPPRAEQLKLLELQDNKCLYCGKKFGTRYVHPDYGPSCLTIHWDHRIPFVYTQSNYGFVAACNVCNSIKSYLMFDTIEEVKNWVSERVKQKGIEYDTED